MTATVALIEPTSLTAGDSESWTIEDSDHPSDVYDLAYLIQGAGRVLWKSDWVTTNGTGYLVTMPRTATPGLPAGTYRFIRIFTHKTDTTIRDTKELPSLVVFDNPENLSAGDGEIAELEAAIKKVDATILEMVTDGLQGYMNRGVQAQKVTLEELRKTRNGYVVRLNALRTGNPLGQDLRFSFPRPSRTAPEAW